MTMTFSRRNFLLGGAAAATALVMPASWARPGGPPAAPATPGDALDHIARRTLRDGACAGIALRISRYGKPLLVRDYGLANLETGTAVAADSVFRVGSLTKQFVAALVVLLTSKKRLQLDEPVSTYLACFKGKPAFSLRELLNHTAGLHDDEPSTSCPAGSQGPRSQRELANAIAAQQPLFDFPPGTAWLYSNTNYIVLGAVVEAVTGLPLARAASTLLFEPLDLRDTAFDDAGDVVRGRVSGYTPVEGHPGAFTHAAFIEISDAGGAGAMRSTAADLCAWHQALFAGKLMPSRFVEAMTAPGRLRDGRLSGAHRFSPADAVYGDVQYGMGLLIEPPTGGHRSVMHYGFINGFAACLESFLDLGVTMALLCNGDMGPGMPFREMRRAIATSWLPRLPAVTGTWLHA